MPGQATPKSGLNARARCSSTFFSVEVILEPSGAIRKFSRVVNCCEPRSRLRAANPGPGFACPEFDPLALAKRFDGDEFRHLLDRRGCAFFHKPLNFRERNAHSPAQPHYSDAALAYPLPNGFL